MVPGLIDVTPPAGLSLGPFPVGFYGLGYVLAAVVIIVVSRARHAAEALTRAGHRRHRHRGRLCHRRRPPVSRHRPMAALPAIHLRTVLPPYSGLGLYGGIIGAPSWASPSTPRSRHPARPRARRRGAGHALRPGHRALGQLLQPGAVRPADRPALGHRHRLRPSHRAVSLPSSALPDAPVPGTTGFHVPVRDRARHGRLRRPLAIASTARGCAMATWPASGWSGTAAARRPRVAPPGVGLDDRRRPDGHAHRRLLIAVGVVSAVARRRRSARPDPGH